MQLLRMLSGLLLAAASCGAAAEPADFDIHFVVMTENLQGPTGTTGADKLTRRPEKVLERFQSHVDKLNTEFRSQSGEQLVRFHLKSSVLYLDVRDSECEAMKAANADKAFHALLGKCNDPRIREPNAVNVYVYMPTWETDHWHSHGAVSDHGPYALIHWKKYHDFNTVMHEIGHSFGLPHVCSNPRPAGTEWNIMASEDMCKKTAVIETGFHFNDKQTAIIKKHIARYQKLFARTK